jgi:hypothetical protein
MLAAAAKNVAVAFFGSFYASSGHLVKKWRNPNKLTDGDPIMAVAEEGVAGQGMAATAESIAGIDFPMGSRRRKKAVFLNSRSGKLLPCFSP